ncbi:uncharacterized protein B0I36DRAFT_394569 [Microdochium trichocladiopsis]|uniref:Uncharacterized protein n=1 Tax=Microdochium trichocladiopsis TaxID=1682393 RepID=A0A9P9BK25_9PEZI|nr:uncharacterized protein B0I36DRAFT_394569 [Microdochium trichocladiopsis]KAH7018001.1 hypothetical protein B0I36DRAFT_394569 [Microdochium trichocladiopsis]
MDNQSLREHNTLRLCYSSYDGASAVQDGWRCQSCKEHPDLMVYLAKSVSWAVSRWTETSLFKYLQGMSNNIHKRSIDEQTEYIFSILMVLYTLRKRSEQLISDHSTETDEALVAGLLDRQHRLQTALWVYCSITIRKMPKWSNIWDKIQRRLPFVFGRETARMLDENFECGVACFRPRAAWISKSAQRYIEISKLAGMANNDVHEDTQSIAMEDFLEFIDLSPRSQLDVICRSRDRYASGGSLTATSSDEGRAAATSAFLTLARLNLVWSEDCHPRFRTMYLENLNMSLVVLHSSPEDALLEIYRLVWDANPSGPIGESYLAQFRWNTRSGQRWTELEDLVGPEVILLGNPVQPFLHGHRSVTLSISQIVEFASDTEFSQFKAAISCHLGWLPDACTRLRGVGQKIMDYLWVDDTESQERLGLQIKNALTEVFGTTAMVKEISDSDERVLKEALVARGRRHDTDIFPAKVRTDIWSYIVLSVPGVGVQLLDDDGKKSPFDMGEAKCRVDSFVRDEYADWPRHELERLREWTRGAVEILYSVE